MAGQIEPIARMAQQLSRLPGIGAKTAQRLAYHIVSLPEDQVHELASAIWQGRKAVKYCSICGNYTVEDPCPICADEKRHNGVICVVRDPRDVAAMERMRDFKGCYHVLHGTISPMEGIGPEDIRIRELLARIHAVLRRRPAGDAPGAPSLENETVRFGEFELDLGTRVLKKNGEVQPLTTGEFAVLKAFARHPRQPLSRDKLMEMARGREYEAFDRSLDVQVSRLRKLIEPDPSKPRYLQTVWGLGYVFIPDGHS